MEGLKTLGICTADRRFLYEAFPLAKPDDFLVVEDFKEIIESNVQAELVRRNSVVIPHGSFVEYVGAETILEKFEVPMFGNRQSLLWETNREKQRVWLESAGLNMPKEYTSSDKIDQRVFVKLPGAKGGRGFFTVETPEDFEIKLTEQIERGLISRESASRCSIQEFIPGVRYYPHYFCSKIENLGIQTKCGSVELLSMDKRIEPIDECYRGLPDIPRQFFDYTVTGNLPVVARESLLPEIMDMGRLTVEKSFDLFSLGLIGAFSLETIYHPDRGFSVFEISARIVAGTNLYPLGSPYSAYLFDKPMSTGRRIARELRLAGVQSVLDRVVY